MLHTSSTYSDIRSERFETTTKKTTETTTAIRPQFNPSHALLVSRDVRLERPERTIGKAIETMVRPHSKLCADTPRQRLRDRLPPPDIPDFVPDTKVS